MAGLLVEQSSETGKNRLFRYDRQIAINATRAALFQWRDRLIAVTMLFIVLIGMRSWFADRTWMIGAWVGLGVALIVGTTVGRLIEARLAFHAFDGLLAADALRRPTRRIYITLWQAIGLMLLTAVTLIARPSLLIVSLPGYLVGAIIGHATGGYAFPRLPNGEARIGRTIRSWLQRPSAGLVGAAILLLLLSIQVNYIEYDALVVVAAIQAAILVLGLTIADDGLIRFATIIGHGSWRIVGRLARGPLLFVGTTVPVCFLAFGPAVAGIIVAISAAALLLMMTRVLIYRLHGKRFADLLTSMIAGILTLVTVSMPFILPFVAFAILWQLQRRAAAKTWMLA